MHDEATAARFWAKVDKSGDCWVWVAARFRGEHGKLTYGMFSVRGKLHFAHRVAWELANGPIPDGLWALHRCDNKPCVRPSHLYLGTHADNTRDATIRHRMPRGVHNANTRLTADQVLAIRRRWDRGEQTAPLAARFGVSTATIGQVVRRVTWTYLSGGERRGFTRSVSLTDSEVAAVVTEYRAGGVSQAALAHRVGVSRPTVTRWVRDPRHLQDAV